MGRTSSLYKVVSYNLDGTIDRIFDSAKEASLLLNAHPRSIDKCIRENSLTLHGYMWRRFLISEIPTTIDPYIKNKRKTTTRCVVKIDENDLVIETYPSINQAAKANGVDTHSLRDNLNNKNKQVKGMRFRYK